MTTALTKLKQCNNCSALIEARAKSCHICNIVFDIPVLTEEESIKTYKEVCEDLNTAFFRFENFMYGNATTYESFNFDRAFTVLFLKTREVKNNTLENFALLDKYWCLTEQIRYDIDKSNFDNELALENPAFLLDSNALHNINYDRLNEFCEFSLPDDTEDKRLSILDIQNEFFQNPKEESVKTVHIDLEDNIGSTVKQKKSKSKKKKKQNDKQNEYTKLISDLELVFRYNYPCLEKPLHFYYNAKESVRAFKYLTPIKLKGLSDNDLRLALKHYDFVLNELLSEATTDFKAVETWLVKYKVDYHMIFHDTTNNELVSFLDQKLPSLRFSLSPEYNKDQQDIQYDFFNYWYGSFLLEASTFIQELNEIITSGAVELGFKSKVINIESLAVKPIAFERSFPTLSKSIMDSFPKHLLKNKDETISDKQINTSQQQAEQSSKAKIDQLKNNNASTPADSKKTDIIYDDTKILDEIKNKTSPVVKLQDLSGLGVVKFPPELLEHIKKEEREIAFMKEAKTSNRIIDATRSKPSVVEVYTPTRFSEIFVEKEWYLYIDALHEIEIKLIDQDYNYIGKEREKGVVCSWIKLLQIRGIINRKLKRQQLATVLNNEFKGFNLGRDGKTFDNYSKVFADKFETILLKHTKLLP